MDANEMAGLASIAKKKAAIMAELKSFAKDRRNESQKYGYASAESIFDTIREKMAEHGLVVFPSVAEHRQDEFKSAKGTPGLHTVVTYRMAWICMETGAVWEDFWVGEGDDYQDKGYSKTATLALKYFLLTSFVVSSGDHADDSDSGLDSKPPQKGQAKVKPAAAAQNGAHKHGERMAVTLSGLTVRARKDDPNRNLLAFKIKNADIEVFAFSRELFRNAGWIAKDDWGQQQDYPITQLIPATAQYVVTQKDDGSVSGYWEIAEVDYNPMRKAAANS